MSETSHRNIEEGSEENRVEPGMYHLSLCPFLPKFTNICETDGVQAPQPSKDEPNFGDSSGPLFSIYSDATKKEDNKMTDRWKADADGILFFVSLCVTIHAALHNLERCRPAYSLLPLQHSLL